MFEGAILAAIASGAAVGGAPSTLQASRRERAPTVVVHMIRAPHSLRVPVALAAAASCLNCRDTTVTPPPPADRVVAIAVVPSVADLGAGETQTFVARNVTAAGDTVLATAVEWHATGGTITPDGVYTAGSDVGLFSVTATRVGGGPLPGRAGVHVFRRVVAMIRVEPDTATLPIQGSWPLQAVALDSAGDSLPTAPITWISANPAVAQVDANGLVTAVAPGTAMITAASQGRSDTALVAVVPPGSGPWPNEPSGFRVITDQPWDLLTSLGWFVQFGVGAIGTDPTARLSPPAVLQIAYPVGFAGGEAPGTLAHELGGLKQVYGGIWWKASNPWQGHNTNVNKIQYVFTSESGSMFMAMYGHPGGPYELRVFPQFKVSPLQWLEPNVNHVPITIGTWHRIEWLIVYNTTDDPPNGICRWWLDGQLIGDYYNVRYPAEPLGEYKLAPVWGGVGDTKRELDYYWYDHVHVSGR
ncbi:MAG: hypothetical protein AUH96_02485 [Nitrospirae bacterium 13_2_20CM_2_61_4]|nr:MAG: hypothetical protein AUH96_02485 [Nitrospirae bacterium 13_2_20CM_2_61_4]